MEKVDVLKSLEEIKRGVENAKARIAYLEQRERDLVAQHEDAEFRARTYERRADEFEAKADRVEELEEKCAKLVVALDRLPAKMEDAGIIPGVVAYEIPLYGTYDWQQVMDAKFALRDAIKKGEK